MVLIDVSNTDTFSVNSGYYIHQYTVPGTRTITVSDGGVVEVLVVAGGGGGATASGNFNAGGGGGGGEVVYLSSFTVRGGNFTVTVGSGGVGGVGGANTNGENSVFGTIQTNGGGAGGTTDVNAKSGGSGGGCGRNNLTRALAVKLYPTGLGNNGGIANAGGATGAAGGGGATGAAPDLPATSIGYPGGPGYTSSITGTAQVYGSGGGGGARASTGGAGGTNAGKGGDGQTTNTSLIDGTSAINGFGGGGGGGGVGGNSLTYLGAGGNGGSGIVVVKYYVGSIIYKPISVTLIKSVLGTTANASSAYRNQRVMHKGLISTLPSSTIARSDFFNRMKAIVTDGLALYFDPANTSSYSGTGTTITDLSGNGRNCALEGSATVNSDKQIVLNGASQYVSTTFQPNLNNLRLYTYELWFWDNSPGVTPSDATALISNYGATNTTPNAVLHINNTGTVVFTERNSSSVSTAVTTPSSVCNSTWTHIVGVATATNLELYINGVSVGTTTRPGGVITSAMNIVIGGHHLLRYQTCRLGPVRIYLDKALSATEVVQNYEAERYRESLSVS